jgi:drug/metabolite transporter (DMT)-like permease
MLSSGTTAIIQKVHQNSDFKAELAPFIFYALLFASLFSLILSFVFKGDGVTKRTAIYKSKPSLLLIFIDGAIIGILNFANLKLAGTIPAVIHFPVYNVCSMLLIAVMGRILFKEKIGARKLVGFGIGLIAITIIGLL